MLNNESEHDYSKIECMIALWMTFIMSLLMSVFITIYGTPTENGLVLLWTLTCVLFIATVIITSVLYTKRLTTRT